MRRPPSQFDFPEVSASGNRFILKLIDYLKQLCGSILDAQGGGLTDGDKGDITVSSSGAAWTVDNDAVTYAKMQNVSAASRLLGRGSASGSGDVQEISLGTGLSMSGTTLSSAVTDGDKGDITVSSSGATWTVDNDAISNAKLANVSTQTIKGRTTASTGDPEDLTAAQAAAVVQGDGLDASLCGFRGLPQNSQSGNYTLVAADAGKHIYHASGAGAGDTYTIPANSSVAFPVGTTVTFVNLDSNSVSVAITTDTLTLANSTTTGTRSLAQNSWATAMKVTSTSWLISGPGLT